MREPVTTDEQMIDALILSLVAADRQATDAELDRIVAHVARAPFSTRPVRTTRWLRERLAQAGITIEQTRLPSVEVHLLKRIHLERQWPVGTTADNYLAGLHRAVEHPAAQVWTYRYYAEPYVGVLAPSHLQDVPSPQPYIFVAYNPRYGTITTGYQASKPENIFTDEFEQVRRQR